MARRLVLLAGLAAIFALSNTASAQEPVRIPLQNGHYVPDGVDCANPPLMSVLIWDSVGFSRGRRSLCTTDAWPADLYVYVISTGCESTVDGIWWPNRTPAQVLKLDSTSEFTLVRRSAGPNEVPVHYRRCAKSAKR